MGETSKKNKKQTLKQINNAILNEHFRGAELYFKCTSIDGELF